MTPSGAAFNLPVTFNVYDANSATPTVPIATATQTFAIPYRPSASAKCTGDNAGKWFDPSTKKCFNGMANNVTFNFPAGTDVPTDVVYGIAYNTSHYGYTPITDSSACPTGGCGYDSLNIGLVASPGGVSAGADDSSTLVYINKEPSSNDTWAGYTPAVQLKARN